MKHLHHGGYCGHAYLALQHRSHLDPRPVAPVMTIDHSLFMQESEVGLENSVQPVKTELSFLPAEFYLLPDRLLADLEFLSFSQSLFKLQQQVFLREETHFLDQACKAG